MVIHGFTKDLSCPLRKLTLRQGRRVKWSISLDLIMIKPAHTQDKGDECVVDNVYP
jgi:hypothetical protein